MSKNVECANVFILGHFFSGQYVVRHINGFIFSQQENILYTEG